VRNNGTIIDAAHINASGNVGIAGQTNPTYKLDGGFANQTWGWYLNSSYNAGMTYNTTDRSLLIHTKSAEALDHIKFATGTAATERLKIDASGYIQMGSPLSTHIGTSQLFVNRGVNAPPATSGTTQTGGALRLRGGNNAVLDMGLNGTNTWIQATDRANLANGYNLSLNPIGGNCGIGVTPAQLLHIKSAAPDIRIEDSDGGYVDLNGANGNLEIRADQGNAVGSSEISFFVDGGKKSVINANGCLGIFGSGATNTRSDMALTSGTAVSTRRWGFGGATGGTSSVFYTINASNVGVYLQHGGQSWTSHSDERIKENITDVGTVLPSLMNMRCVKYNLISNPTDTKIGFIAQDWESAFPEVVDEDEHLVLEDDGSIGIEDDSDSTTPVKAMAYTETIPLLLKAIQEQQTLIEALTARITALEGE
jgi:hypothetical protein